MYYIGDEVYGSADNDGLDKHNNRNNNNHNDSNTLFDEQVGKWKPLAESWTYYTNSNRIQQMK